MNLTEVQEIIDDCATRGEAYARLESLFAELNYLDKQIVGSFIYHALLNRGLK